MAKLTIEEFNNKYSSQIVDNDDLLISLMEDFSDSISYDELEELSRIKEELESERKKFLDLKEKYKLRFLNAITDDDKIREDDKREELEEATVIDIKEI